MITFGKIVIFYFGFLRWLIVIAVIDSYSPKQNGNDTSNRWKDEHLCVETKVQEVKS